MDAFNDASRQADKSGTYTDLHRSIVKQGLPLGNYKMDVERGYRHDKVYRLTLCELAQLHRRTANVLANRRGHPRELRLAPLRLRLKQPLLLLRAFRGEGRPVPDGLHACPELVGAVLDGHFDRQ